jgi:tetratricopeptide (TPR) repeat protein
MITRLRAVAIVATAAALCWFAVSFTLGMVLSRRSPEMALSWWSYGARARAGAAHDLLTKQRSPEARERALSLAQAALQREPVNVAAARSLAIAAAFARDEALANRYLAYAEGLSRRDVGTQLLLLEREVRRNDVPSALRHYDRALRVSTDARGTLLPIMIGAAADPAIAAEIARLLDPRPPYWFAFGERLVLESTSPAAMTMLLGRLRLDPADERERSLMIIAVRRLIEMGAHRHAEQIYRRAGGAALAPNGSQVRNGDFDSSEIGLPPFDWLLVNESQLGAFKERSDPRGGNVLRLTAENGRGGEVARQLLRLAPGRYRLDAMAGDVQGEPRPRLAIICAGRGGPSLVVLEFPDAGSSGARLGSAFAVPRGACPAQWLTVIAASSIDVERAAPWLDAISVRSD